MTQFVPITTSDVSLSARRAWIEISLLKASKTGGTVALRKESVDRNTASARPSHAANVALRKESVDRNDNLQVPASVSKVALRKESVDRNIGAS